MCVYICTYTYIQVKEGGKPCAEAKAELTKKLEAAKKEL
jgi:hypothetical protein